MNDSNAGVIFPGWLRFTMVNPRWRIDSCEDLNGFCMWLKW